MTAEKPLILITNDDGLNAPGLRYLIECISNMDCSEIVVVAPSGPRSGQASAITVDSPLRVTRTEDYLGAQMWSCTGTPVDCVKLAMNAVVPRRPALLLSGINHGSNSGINVLYSGTMGAVMEGCLLGIPSVGFSLLHHSWSADFSKCGSIVDHVSRIVLSKGLPAGVCLNVNIPARCIPKGLKVTRGSMGHWTDEYAKYVDPHGEPYYWLTGKYVDDNPDDPTTDNYWLDRQYATIVPIRPDQTANNDITSIATSFD